MRHFEQQLKAAERIIPLAVCRTFQAREQESKGPRPVAFLACSRDSKWAGVK